VVNVPAIRPSSGSWTLPGSGGVPANPALDPGFPLAEMDPVLRKLRGVSVTDGPLGWWTADTGRSHAAIRSDSHFAAGWFLFYAILRQLAKMAGAEPTGCSHQPQPAMGGPCLKPFFDQLAAAQQR